ncbi:MBL fold metallo-hydrolase [Planctomyces sp. SH-PL62]|uniref:MBL fold metallo-hydrolase n=1 Tax=Planctomyces sp. SH-PL62 TaxID=1636152 RepID=UPI00078DB8CB|nr:MBL fold metallo-hydrolase [Planctomyces sp. SH-PL62]AMV36799.1 putative metallo-hydrolase [Planctomyces sp. SH-PL62]
MAEFTIDVVESAPYAQMAYVLWRPDRSDAIVVDPGFDAETILELLEHDGKTLAAILNTHGHVDHIAGNAALKAAHPQAPLIIGRGDSPLLADGARNLSLSYGQPVLSPPADRLVDDGDRLEFAGFSLLVREIPGHSPGSVVYILDAEEPPAVLGGDVLFAGSIGRTDFGGDPSRDFEVLMSGIVAKLMTLAEETLIYPGHGGVTTIGAERQSNPFVRDYLARTSRRDA